MSRVYPGSYRAPLTPRPSCYDLENAGKPAHSFFMPPRASPELLPGLTTTLSPRRTRRSRSIDAKTLITPPVRAYRQPLNWAIPTTFVSIDANRANTPDAIPLRRVQDACRDVDSRPITAWYNCSVLSASGASADPCPSTVRKSASFDPTPKPTMAGTCPARLRSGSGRCGS